MNYFLRLNLLSAVLIFCPGLQLQAQKITVRAQLDSTVLWIGDQSNLSFEISQSPEQTVSLPLFFDTIPGGLEVVGLHMDSVKSKDGYLLVTQHYTVTAFEDSLYYVPSFPFVAGDDTVWSNPLSLKVIQPFQIDSASNVIADIKPIYNPKFDWKWFIKLLLLILLIIAVLVLAYFLIRKFVLKKPILPAMLETKESLPPHLVALAALDKIKDEKLWQQGRIKEYHTELTDVLRAYIERVF
ncbi:MAG: BatD family protein, partial [Prevotellaceae bacterium]|nr:BatD family protein [Prevotellaceae bacterium]